MRKLKFSVLSVLFIFMAGILCVPKAVSAAVIKNPTFIYGAGLSAGERMRTAELLGIESLNGMTVEPVHGYDLDNYLNTGIYTSDAEMISSVAVVEEKKGSGIDLAITPRRISHRFHVSSMKMPVLPQG